MRNDIKRGLAWIFLQIFLIVFCVVSVLAVDLYSSGYTGLSKLVAR